jgi:hypothetical protein
MQRLPSKTQLDRLYVFTNKLVRLLEPQGYEFNVSMIERELHHDNMDDRSDEGFHEEVSWPPWTAGELRDLLTEEQSTSTTPP